MKKTGWMLCFLLSVQLLSGISQGCFLMGDLNGDCRVDIQDLLIMASQWMGPSCGNETGLILHWRLDETVGITAADSSGWGRHGTVVGAHWNPMGGILRGTLQFDGLDDYVWTSYQGITGSNPRTCAAWIKTDRAPGDMIAWGNREVEGGRWVVKLDPTGVLCVDVGGGYIIGTTVLTDDLWHHIAVTFDGSTTDSIVLYVDGKREAIGGIVPQAVSTQAWATTKLGVFERQQFLGNHYFEGLMDDARIYNRALHLKEVWNLATMASTLYDCADLNTDQTVTLSDVAVLSENWGAETPHVLINEFLASNRSKSPLGPGQILDGDFEASDWIELYNNSRIPVDISGWYLTDDAGDPTQWRFPLSQPTLQPGDYLLVFASGKTQAENPDNDPYVDPAGYLHTNFSVSKDGEYLGLFAADGITPIHEYNHIALGGGVYGFPPQEDDISYGYYYGQPRYFAVPTPGADNIAGAYTGFVEKPDVNVKGGCYETGFDLILSCATEAAFIRYTLDGTVPSLVHGLEYTGPIAVSSFTTLIARAFKPGLHPSDARIETYIFVEPEVAAFHSNLPIVVVDTLGQSISSDKLLRPFSACRAVIIDADQTTGRASVVGSEYAETSGIAEIRRRGESTYGQGHYALEFRDEYGLDREVSLLGMPAESEWILSFDVIDYTLLKNEVAFKWFRDMGHYAPRQRYVEVYLNTGGGTISTSDFVGIMVLREQIGRDKNRVDIARLDESHNLEPKVSGGYIIKSDKYNDGDTLLADGSGGSVDPDYLESAPYGIQVTGGGKPILQYPPARRVTLPQIEWIAGYMNQVSAVLWQNTSSSFYPGPEVHYTDYLDAVSWIDHFIVEQTGLDLDAFWGSYRIHKDRGGKIFSGPVWDFDRGFHNNGGTYNQPYNVWRTNAGFIGKWHQKMQECPEYKIQLADRWYEHRKAAINTDQTLAHIDAQVALMSEAMARTNKQKPSGHGYTWEQQIDFFKTWIVNRLTWLDGEIANRFAARPPIFNPAGGEVNLGDMLYISKPSGASGTIYYTLDGSDPRLPGGGVNPNAQIYTESNATTIESMVTLSSSVWKYLYDGSDQGTAWRAYGFGDSSWGSGPGRLGFGQDGIVTDIGPRVAGRRSAYFRHVFNVSNVSAITAVEMTVVHDDGAVVYLNGQEIGRIFMPDGEIQYDTLAATTVHSTPVTTVFSGISPAFLVEGENILAVSVHQVTDNSSDIVFDLDLEASRIAGPSQIIFDKSLCVRSRIKDGDNWSAWNQERYAAGPVAESLRISEIMYHPAGGSDNREAEWLELQNIGSETINLGMVKFTEGIDYQFGDINLEPGHFLVLAKNITMFNTLNPDFEGNIVWGYEGMLSNSGERIRLEDALGKTVEEFEYKDGWYSITGGDGFSLTVIDTTAANDLSKKSSWKPSSTPGGSPGQADTGSTPLPGAIVINELLAHSHDVAPDWIELHNTTDQPINIGGWYISDSGSADEALMKYQIPLDTIIPAYGFSVFYEGTDFTDFAFSANGETAYLTSAVDGQLGSYRISESFGASPRGVAFGRYYKAGTDSYNFVLMSTNTPGAANAYPLVGPLVISEIMYHPPQLKDAEYVELLNISDETIQLYDADKETGWKFADDGGIEFYFPSGSSIAPGERILIVKNRTIFAGQFTAAAGTQIFEWSGDGNLSNAGEKIELSMPGDIDGEGTRCYIRVDRVVYSDGSHPVGSDPWPTAADGNGQSLHRIDNNAYGNDIANWTAAPPTPGM